MSLVAIADTAARVGCGGESTRRQCYFSVPAPKVDESVLDQIGRVLDLVDDPTLSVALERAWAALQAPNDGRASRLAELDRDAAKLRTRITKTRAALMDAEGDQDEERELNDVLRDARQELKANEAERQRLGAATQSQEQLPPLHDALAEAGSWVRVLREGTILEQREVLGHMMEAVKPVVLKKGKGGRWKADMTLTLQGDRLRQLAKAAGKLGAQVATGATPAR